MESQGRIYSLQVWASSRQVDVTTGKSVLDVIDVPMNYGSHAEIQNNVFLYAGQSVSERFCMELMSPGMRIMARKHCHLGVCVINRTFGMAREKLLIFSLITKDERGRSVLAGVFLFAPDKDALSASASYDSNSLVKVFSLNGTPLQHVTM